MAICEMRGVVKHYKQVTALNKFDMEVREGEILGLLGPNGSGKTTAINCLLGLLKYDGGEITVLDQAPASRDPGLKRRIGLVPSDLAYFEELSVIDNISYFAGLYETNKREQKRMTGYAVDFAGLGKYRKFPAKKLSGGLKRRLNIACGIVHSPEFLVLDEPTLALDAQSRKYVLNGVRELNRQGTTVLYTTHYLEEAQELCDRIVIIDEGHNMATGTLPELIGLIDAEESVHIELPCGEKEAELLERVRSLDGVVDLFAHNGRVTVKLAPPGHHLAALIESLRLWDIAYSTISSELPTLNEVFLSLTGKALRE
ncbi:MAG TPA: ABC transporter ATP-binding protein [Bacillota bacterium]|jgi:ABC-2 type transport system ATP-binding protein|nr:ABC transporter ATP-binding protein [Fastidiosipila sp.]HQB81001.1 ABC transporter ATP-binding protein [Bacillota bacterium]